jgi:hypothetical protein
MNTVSAAQQRNFKRQKTNIITEFPTDVIGEDKTVFDKKIVNSSFASGENVNASLFKSELSYNLAYSLILILHHRKLEKCTKMDLKSVKFDITNLKTIPVVVLSFNMIHAILNNLHTSRAKLRHVESDLLESCDAYIENYIETT